MVLSVEISLWCFRLDVDDDVVLVGTLLMQRRSEYGSTNQY